MRDVWYVLEDGTKVSPAHVAPNDAGALVHKDGAAVAMGSHGNPVTTGVELDEAGELINEEEKDMKPETGKKLGYKTRGAPQV
ncbi:MAG: hypothetical protein ABJA10_07635 [Aestuariivirga sp.]